jgi:glycosyltransferase involved in cell wall biosynthesis
MKILFVAMAESIHTVRWVNQLKNEGWDLYLFPSYDYPGLHNDLNGIKVCIPFLSVFTWLDKLGLGKYSRFLYVKLGNYKKNKLPDYYEKRLKRYINSIKPDMIHSLETQGAGYLVAKVKCEYPPAIPFPAWWHTNWGSDIFLFGRIPQEQPFIRRVLENCEFYSCECTRDIELAKDFGFKGKVFPVYPNTGGFDPIMIDAFKAKSQPTSERKLIMLKGYQGWAGRALVAIRGLERCADLINKYHLVIYANASGEDVEIASTLLSQNTGVAVTILPSNTPHKEIMRFHSQARISIGLSIGDAISTSLLEAMAMGSFPIQSCTACASEWFTDGISGLIVTPEDPEVVEQAIRRALLDDILVNSAAEINYNKIVKDANFETLRVKTIQAYKKVLNIDHVQ